MHILGTFCILVNCVVLMILTFVFHMYSIQPSEAKTDQIGLSSLKDSSNSSVNNSSAADLFSIHNFEVSIHMDLPSGGLLTPLYI